MVEYFCYMTLFSWLNKKDTAPLDTSVDSSIVGLSLPQVPEVQLPVVLEHPVQKWLKGAVKEARLPQEFIVPEATTLRICVDTLQPYKPFNWESLAYLLSQMVRISRIEFVGSADPITHLPALPDVIMQLKQAYPAITVCVTSTGESLLTPAGLALLRTPLDELRLALLGHMPSWFEQLSGQPITVFSKLQAAVYRYITHRLHLGKEALLKTITAVYVVNNHNYQRMIPDMLRQAEQLGVDAVQFNNTVSESMLFKPLADVSTLWYEALQADDTEAVTYFHTFPVEDYRVAVEWPTLWRLPTKTDTGIPLQGCKAAFHTVTVNLGFQASGCPRWQIGTRETDWYPVWRGDFWHNEHFQAIRAVHHLDVETEQFKVEPVTGVLQSPIGFEACGDCPHRCTAMPEFQLSKVNQHLLVE